MSRTGRERRTMQRKGRAMANSGCRWRMALASKSGSRVAVEVRLDEQHGHMTQSRG